MPQHIQFVWHGLNDMTNLEQFLTTGVHWGELSIWMDSLSDEFISIFGFFAEASLQKIEFRDTLASLRMRGKGVKLDLKGGDRLIESVLDLVRTYDFKDSNLRRIEYV